MSKPLRSVARYIKGQKAHYIGNIRMTGVGVDADTVTLNGLVYLLNNGTAATGAQIDVDITGGQTDANVVDALVTAINGQYPTEGIVAVDNTDEVVLYGDQPFTLAETLTNGTVDPATAAGGNNYTEVHPVSIVERAPTAAEVTKGELKIVMAAPVEAATVVVKVTSSGAGKAWDGDTLVSGNTITIDNAGATDWAATDTVDVIVQTAPVTPA